jgi:hypothetical protein
MRIENRKARDEINTAASFKTAVMSVSGAVVSVCIKYAMYDRDFRLSHWSTTQILALYRCRTLQQRPLLRFRFAAYIRRSWSFRSTAIQASHPYNGQRKTRSDTG